MRRRIALVVGDTLGHFYPALSIAEQFARVAPETEIVMVGPRGGVAAALAARHAYPYEGVDSSPWPRAGVHARASAAAHAWRGMRQARRALRRHGSRFVIGFGGHASAVVIPAARSLGLLAAIHEGNVLPGRANRWLARVATRAYVHYAASVPALPGARALVTGWPVRRSIATLARGVRTPPSRHRPLHVLVLEGTSRESGFLARHVPSLLAGLVREGSPTEVWHQHTAATSAILADAYGRAGLQARVEPFVEPVADAYAWADLVIARAGAGVLAEVASAGVPALVVPLRDAADDHQTLNAQRFATSGAGLWVREDDWAADVLGPTVAALLRDPARWTAASSAARGLAAPDAADRVVADCETLMRGRW